MSVARNDSALRLTRHVMSQVFFPPVLNIKKLSFLMSSCGRGTRRSTPHHTCRDPSTPGPPTFTRSPHLSLPPGRSSGGSSAGDKGRPAVQTVGGSYQHIYLIEIRAPLIRNNGPPVLQLLEIWNLKRRTKSATLMSGLFSPSLPRSENIVFNWYTKEKLVSIIDRMKAIVL